MSQCCSPHVYMVVCFIVCVRLLHQHMCCLCFCSNAAGPQILLPCLNYMGFHSGLHTQSMMWLEQLLATPGGAKRPEMLVI